MGRVVDRDELARCLEEPRSHGRSIVFTNGCFDLLHIGHVRYLAEARSYGDLLVVGVNTDASVRALKGPRRPLIPEAERAEMLAHLATVDFVTLFGEPTADALIEVVRPAIYAKGGDVILERVPEAPTVRRLGGTIRIAGKVEEHSTSDIVERVLRAYDAADAA